MSEFRTVLGIYQKPSGLTRIIVFQVGKWNERLPTSIPFTILSGDKGFCEVERQMEASERRTVCINPHHKTPDMVYMLLHSVADT